MHCKTTLVILIAGLTGLSPLGATMPVYKTEKALIRAGYYFSMSYVNVQEKDEAVKNFLKAGEKASPLNDFFKKRKVTTAVPFPGRKAYLNFRDSMFDFLENRTPARAAFLRYGELLAELSRPGYNVSYKVSPLYSLSIDLDRQMFQEEGKKLLKLVKTYLEGDDDKTTAVWGAYVDRKKTWAGIKERSKRQP